jgi:hypothetical protein
LEELIKEWFDQASSHKYIYEVKDQEIDVGRRSHIINAQENISLWKADKENIYGKHCNGSAELVLAIKQWRDNNPDEISNGTIPQSAIKGVQGSWREERQIC